MPLTHASLDQIVSVLNRSKEDRQSESMKFDFKRKWYDLKDQAGISEFLKDTSAIANTFGPDGYIVIGYDDHTREYFPASFKDSGLKDTGFVNDIIAKHVDPLYHIDITDEVIEGNQVSVIHILPSLAKPHVIRKYITLDKKGEQRTEDNRIFVRNTTATVRAARYDLELMYYDRKNITPEHEIFTSFNLKDLISSHYTGDIYTTGLKHNVVLDFVIENTGRRPLAIKKVNFLIVDPLIQKTEPLFNLASDQLHQFSPGIMQTQTIVIQSGQIMRCQITFISNTNIVIKNPSMMESIAQAFTRRSGFVISPFLFTLSNNEKVISVPTIVK